jgi:hypothetical protein
MSLSKSWTNREVTQRKVMIGREKLTRVYAGNDFKDNWILRREVQMKIADMTNRQVYAELKSKGFRFDNERADWLST